MKFRIGSYNVNNLFERASVMQLDGFSLEAAPILEDIRRLNELLGQTSYQGSSGTQIIKFLEKYLLDPQYKGRWFTINEIRGKLSSVKRDGTGIKLVAKGRNDWLGWVELVKDAVHEVSTENTGRIIKTVGADILCVVEVEHRVALNRFNRQILKGLHTDYPHVMLIDGNDERGIDVGVLSQYPIASIRSHVDDLFTAGNKQYPIFSRDCAEYEITLPNDSSLWMLCNHFKSKGYGNPQQNDAKRLRQTSQVKKILQRFNLKNDYVVVAGDFNDTPNSAPLKPLLSLPDLHNVADSPHLSGPTWTYQDGKGQIDYLLLSTPLWNALTAVGIERRGIFKTGNPHLPEVTNKITQASDHAAVWADISL